MRHTHACIHTYMHAYRTSPKAHVGTCIALHKDWPLRGICYYVPVSHDDPRVGPSKRTINQRPRPADRMLDGLPNNRVCHRLVMYTQREVARRRENRSTLPHYLNEHCFSVFLASHHANLLVFSSIPPPWCGSSACPPRITFLVIHRKPHTRTRTITYKS